MDEGTTRQLEADPHGAAAEPAAELSEKLREGFGRVGDPLTLQGLRVHGLDRHVMMAVGPVQSDAGGQGAGHLRGSHG